MKKFLICIIMMMLSIITTKAEDTNTMNAEAFHIQCNVKSLAKVLDATKDQAEAVNDVMSLFEMQTALVATEENDNIRKNMMKSAVKDNVRLMNSVLNKDQMASYLRVLNATLKNRNVDN